MRRRKFIMLFGSAAATWPLAAYAQQPAMSRIGVVLGFNESDPVAQALVAAFREKLQTLGGRRDAIYKLMFDMPPMIATRYAPWQWN
jgi:hypothetical protein